MTKEEVLERIRKGESYLQRTDLTHEQPDEPAVPADVLAHMNRIRGILGMPLRER